MHKLQIAFTFAYMLALCLGCSAVQPNPTPQQDAGPEAAECSDHIDCACQHLCYLDCVECDEHCEQSIGKLLADRLMPFSTQCIIESTNKTQAAGCPGIVCKE